VKILLMGFSKIKYMPYLRFYLENIDLFQNDVHVLYWNRDKKYESLDEYKNITFFEFCYYQQDNVPAFSKIPNFLKYRAFAKKLINKEKYDYIIFLHSLPGILIFDLLKRRYKNNYIFDYRDITYENNILFKKLIHTLVNGSAATFISSIGFKQVLPTKAVDKIYLSHNLMKESLEYRDIREKHGISSDTIRIAYWGFIRNEKVNRLIIERFSNDYRFELHFYGKEEQLAERLKAYTKELNAKNIYFHGEYVPEDRYEFICKTDIIHNVFDDSNMMLAMSNRFYDSLIFRIPQICMKGSVMGNRVASSNLGLCCNPESAELADEVYSYFKSIDVKSFKSVCDDELEKIIKEYQESCNCIQRLIR